MTYTALSARAAVRPSAALFAAAAFLSAALVFLLEPMIGQLLLPRLGGSPAVWNTSLAFFQIALLLGYGYAHLLQRLGSLRRQIPAHLAVLAAAALTLPLRIGSALGQGSPHHPILWLMAVLALSVGAPFVALSATAPLLQAWFARIWAGEEGRNPYALYAASNLGSLIGLLAYPFAVQPTTGLRVQTLAWSIGYLGFAALVALLSWTAWVARAEAADFTAPRQEVGPAPRWRERAAWLLLAAAPSSLLLGVTTQITTDVASAPFLWAPPLALYLLTFVIAFSTRPLIRPETVLLLQAAATPLCLWLAPIRTRDWLPLLCLHLVSFFLTALMCHQALARRRPHPGRLTEFYLLVSLGGVIGGAFNAFLAPVIFDDVWEYPLVLVLAALARPWTNEPAYGRTIALMLAGLGCVLFLAQPDVQIGVVAVSILVALTLVAAFLLRGRPPAFLLLCAGLAVAGVLEHARYQITDSRRSFFGVVQLGEADIPELGGGVRYMMHGSTVHGAEALTPAWRCTPLTYYEPTSPIGQVFTRAEANKSSLSFGLIGLGTGTASTYVRASDRMRVFEIDPLIVRLASDPRRFGYLSSCARGAVDVVLGDARLSLEREPPGRFDVLLVDAFSSDSVPVHLLTVEAMRLYLRQIRPDGVVILHLSNRNLELVAPASAAVAEAGGASLTQAYAPPRDTPMFKDASSIVVIAARTPQALEAFRRDPRWRATNPHRARAWTDDYSNVIGALVRQMLRRP
jgi:hypothetical protein